MNPIKLVALDEEDLRIVSAHVQDAVMKVGDLDYVAGARHFIAVMNRFAWEKKTGFLGRGAERRRSVLHFDRVLKVRTAGIARERPDDVLSVLALGFTPSEPPAGTIEMLFSGGATVRLEVECVEARLADLGAAWEAASRPAHDG